MPQVEPIRTDRREYRQSASYPIGPRDRSGLVYFLECDGFIKIGFSRCVQSRIDALQAGSPHPIRLVAAFRGKRKAEQALHARFTALRVRPRWEWFRPGPELLAFIDTVKLAAMRDRDAALMAIETLRTKEGS